MLNALDLANEKNVMADTILVIPRLTILVFVLGEVCLVSVLVLSLEVDANAVGEVVFSFDLLTNFATFEEDGFEVNSLDGGGAVLGGACYSDTLRLILTLIVLDNLASIVSNKGAAFLIGNIPLKDMKIEFRHFNYSLI